MREGGEGAVRRHRKIRYTDAEWSSVVDRARAAGRPPSRYVRETSLGAVPRVRRAPRDADLIHELGRIGTTLSRLAIVARAGASFPQAAAFDAVLADLLALVRRLDRPRRERTM